jgi:hypothetical protein
MTETDKDLYSGLIRLHVLHHAAQRTLCVVQPQGLPEEYPVVALFGSNRLDPELAGNHFERSIPAVAVGDPDTDMSPGAPVADRDDGRTRQSGMQPPAPLVVSRCRNDSWVTAFDHRALIPPGKLAGDARKDPATSAGQEGGTGHDAD